MSRCPVCRDNVLTEDISSCMPVFEFFKSDHYTAIIKADMAKELKLFFKIVKIVHLKCVKARLSCTIWGNYQTCQLPRFLPFWPLPLPERNPAFFSHNEANPLLHGGTRVLSHVSVPLHEHWLNVDMPYFATWPIRSLQCVCLHPSLAPLRMS